MTAGFPGTGGTAVVIGIGGMGASAAGAAQAACSTDLQSVLDPDGATLQACPSDQGCADATCIPACDAAARSKGSIGCEFWAAEPRAINNGLGGGGQDGPCYAVVLANAWSRPAKISVSRAGESLDVTTFAKIPKGSGEDVQYEPLPDTGLPPEQVAVLFLSHKRGENTLACPVAPAFDNDTAIWASGRGAAFHVVSDTPLSAYDILPYDGFQSAFASAALLLPATTWDTNYIALAPKYVGLPGQAAPSLAFRGDLWATIVAREDGTTVRVAPQVSLPGSDALPAAPAGQVTEYELSAGEFIQWIDPILSMDSDPTGSVFESDKPVGLFTGNTWLSVASATTPLGGYQDSAHQQITPVRALGSEYVGGGIVSRLPDAEPESVPYRIMGVVSGTQLSWDPLPSSVAPLELEEGQVADFETTAPFSVRSQDAEHPFLFTQFMPGQPVVECTVNQGCPLGDEEWVSLISTQQFLQTYVFFTDPSYANTNLVVVRKRSASGFHDVELECLGTIDGWEPVGSEGTFQVARVDLVRGGVPVEDCGTARHVAKSAGAFGIVVWGTDIVTSYGYPAGGNFGRVNDVVVPPLVR
jgi:hypothetical protein